MTYTEIAAEHVAELYPLIVYARPLIGDVPPGTVLGTWAYSCRNKVRFIFDAGLEMARGVLPSDVARAWIRTEYTLPIKRRGIQMIPGYSVPLHARRGDFGECAYVDMHKAFVQVLKLGWDLEYSRGKYIGATPRPVPDEISGNKFAYSIAVSMSGTKVSNLQVMGKEGVFRHKPLNMFSNPCLRNLAFDTLNGIGSEVLALLGENCVYINTDGYIVRTGWEQFTIDIVRSWGFAASIRVKDRIELVGDTTIKGVGSYKIGQYKTHRYRNQAHDFTGKLMSEDERLWLKKRWRKWNARIN